MKLLEDAGLVLFGNARSCISHADVEVAVYGLSGDTHLARIGELDRVAYEVEKDLSEALLVAEPDGQRLGHLGLERELLVLCQRLGGRAHRLDHALDDILGHVQSELAGLTLRDVENGVDEAQ